ncbi:MAG: hypothetical protein ACJA04_000119 [Cellvibrionaceae bacterium]|jgi:hypothetical protein
MDQRPSPNTAVNFWIRPFFYTRDEAGNHVPVADLPYRLTHGTTSAVFAEGRLSWEGFQQNSDFMVYYGETENSEHPRSTPLAFIKH